MSESIIPVVLFAYARPKHLGRVLACLLENRVPLIYAYIDGAKDKKDEATVREVRAMLRAIDWTEVRLIERKENLGLGLNILAGVTEVASQYSAFIVWEDDLICVPGTYAWVCAALEHYANDAKVMSVTAWNHARVVPPNVVNQPYFDGRAECWVWGGYARSWAGMEQSAIQKMKAVRSFGISPSIYGADLPAMARDERRKNIWAVRWLYHHIQHGGLCLRPPWSMVEHIGSDGSATNCTDLGWLGQSDLRTAPQIPRVWPDVQVDSQCPELWRDTTRDFGVIKRLKSYLGRLTRR